MVDIERIHEQKMIWFKYASDYFRALDKIQARNSENCSSEEYELTPEENEALRYYINNNEHSISRRSR